MSTFVTSPYVGCSAAEKPFWPKRDKSQGFGDSVPESGKPPFPYFVLRAGPASRTGFCSSHPLVRTTHTKQRRTLFNVSRVIPELDAYSQEAVQVSTLALTPFTQRVKQLVEHPVVMRLGVFTQLGLLNLVYPTALHTLLEHSLGTFSICCQYVLAPVSY